MIGKAYLKSDSDITELSHARTVIGEGGANVAVDGSVSET
uniref:Uncharacterized protein n=1 Tax=Ciona savignyi TaxID=51511 RepID=H2Y4W5_CIOSA